MKTSIIIPTFNRASLVSKAIQSSLDQTVDCEVIVCDHGSTDETPDVVVKFGSDITYIRRDRDFGPHFCWLEGVLHANGDLIHLQYDDDWIAPEFIARLVELMTEDVGFAFCNAGIMDPTSGQKRMSLDFLKGKVESGTHLNRLLEKRLLKGRVISPGACLFRKQETIDAIYQGRLPMPNSQVYHGVGPDIFLMLLSMLRYPKFGYINEDLAFFGEHDTSITVAAQSDPERQKRFDAAYRSVGRYFNLLQSYQRHTNLFDLLLRMRK